MITELLRDILVLVLLSFSIHIIVFKGVSSYVQSLSIKNKTIESIIEFAFEIAVFVMGLAIGKKLYFFFVPFVYEGLQQIILFLRIESAGRS